MDFVMTVLAFVGTVFGAVACNMAANELYDRAPSLARRIIKHASMRVPSRKRASYTEEWLAHLDECDGKLSKFLHACGCWRATYKLVDQGYQKAKARKVRLYEFVQMHHGISLCPRFFRQLFEIAGRMTSDPLFEPEHINEHFAVFEFVAKRFSCIQLLCRSSRCVSPESTTPASPPPNPPRRHRST